MPKDQINYPTCSLPFGDDIASYFRPKNDLAVLKSSIMLIVMTSIGEKCMEPDFGTSVPRLSFEQLDVGPETESVKSDIERAVQRFDPRLVVDEVKYVTNPGQNRATITILASEQKNPNNKIPLTFEFGV